MFRKLVFVGVDEIDIGMRLKQFRCLEKRIRLEQVVMIEQADPFALRFGKAAIGRHRNASVLLKANQTDARVA